MPCGLQEEKIYEETREVCAVLSTGGRHCGHLSGADVFIERAGNRIDGDPVPAKRAFDDSAGVHAGGGAGARGGLFSRQSDDEPIGAHRLVCGHGGDAFGGADGPGAAPRAVKGPAGFIEPDAGGVQRRDCRF